MKIKLSCGMILFDKPYCKIHHYKDSNTIHMEWNGRASIDQFRAACEYSLDLMQELNVKKLIADNSKVSVVAIECQNWLTRDWFPRALAKGFQYSAVIVSNDAFVKFAVKRIENNIDNRRFVVQYFAELNAALEWLSTADDVI